MRHNREPVIVYDHSFELAKTLFFSACSPPPVLRTNPLKKDTGRYTGSQVVRCEGNPTPPVPMVRSTFVITIRFPFLLFLSFSILQVRNLYPPFFAVFYRGFLISRPVRILFCSSFPSVALSVAWGHCLRACPYASSFARDYVACPSARTRQGIPPAPLPLLASCWPSGMASWRRA